jgi:hypothetical protein
MKKKIDAVVPSVRLNKLVETWNARGAGGAKAPEQSSAAWLKLCKFVRDNKVSRDQLLYALIKIRGMKESRLLRFQRSAEAGAMLDRALAGEDVTIRDLRVGADSTPAEIIRAKLRNAARGAIDEAMKYDAFIGEASAAYAQARLMADARSAKQKHIVLDDVEENVAT